MDLWVSFPEVLSCFSSALATHVNLGVAKPLAFLKTEQLRRILRMIFQGQSFTEPDYSTRRLHGYPNPVPGWALLLDNTIEHDEAGDPEGLVDDT